jgi:hypothetical protein
VLGDTFLFRRICLFFGTPFIVHARISTRLPGGTKRASRR